MNANVEKPGQCEAMTKLCIALLHDARSQFPSYLSVDFNKDILELQKRAKNERVGFFTHTLPKLSSGLFSYLENGSGKYPNFAKKGANEYPQFLSGIFALAYGDNEERKTEAIRFIYQFSVSFKKLKGPYSPAILRSQMEDFLTVDSGLPCEFSMEADNEIISLAQDILTGLFKPINEDNSIFYDSIIPRPGPGATNTKVAHHERYKINRFYSQIDSFFPMDEFFYPTYKEYAWDIPNFRKKRNDSEETPCARFKYVDKVVGKARGICIEENEMQYMQQGVKRFLYQWIEKHPLTKGYVNFTYQSINQQLALASSSDLSYATLDMKDASDRISRHLVDVLFSGVPFLRDALLHLSTRVIDVSDYSEHGKYYCKKYAAMGSGLCFPIMSLVHFALLKAILQLSMHPDDSNRIYVYGDDIILPSRSAQAAFDWLPRFGMKFNETKSFVKSKFRESCGVHAYNGVDITPVYFKYTTEMIMQTEAHYSLISNEALLYTKGYNATSAFIRRHATLPYVGEGSSACGWKRPQDFLDKCYDNLSRYRRRWNQRLHCTQYLLHTFKEVKEGKCTSDDNQMYLRALLIKSHSHDAFWARSRVKRQRVWLSISDIFSQIK